MRAAVLTAYRGDLEIQQVPDPVFSQRMVGDGLAIDPLSQLLRAPCAGTVTQLFATGHALTLTTPEGVEVMITACSSDVMVGTTRPDPMGW